MDEMGARALLERMSVAEPPASRVNIALARQNGAQRLRRRRWAAGMAPLLAAAVVAAVIAGTGALSRGAGSGGGGSGPVSPARVAVPRHPFNPLAPYAAFGWLPKGGTRTLSSPTSTLIQLQLTIGSAAKGQFMLTVWAPATCNLDAAKVRAALRGGHHPALDCEDTLSGWRAELGRPAPAVHGRPGFWFGGHELAWEYAPHAWATLYVSRRGTPIPDATILKVAARVKYAATAKPSVRFPFRLTGLPASWRVTSAPWRATADGPVATPNIGWEGGYPTVGPADGRYAGTIRQIVITPGKSKCPFFRGSSTSRWVVLNGVTAVVTRFTGSGVRPYQGLCVPQTHGLHVMFLELPEPGRGGFAFGGVTGIFLHHLRLLGPDPANWTTHPLGGP
jgi:hypothetical protein